MTSKLAKYSRIINLSVNPSRFLRGLHWETEIGKMIKEHGVSLKSTASNPEKYNVTKDEATYEEQKKEVDAFIKKAKEFRKMFIEWNKRPHY